jgi:hypothetical protein
MPNKGQRGTMAETRYQRYLIETIESMLPGCFIMKNDSSYVQGVPDLLILYGTRWAMLEVKASSDAPEEPNQDYYVDLFNNMSFGAFIFPENEREVLHALQRSLETRRSSRVS